MYLFPFRVNIILHSNLSEKEIIARLKNITGNSKESYRHFTGQISGSSFQLINSTVGNHLCPLVTGKVERGLTGTEIKLQMKVQQYGFWGLTAFVVVFLAVAAYCSQQRRLRIAVPFQVAIVLIFLIAAFIAWNSEMKKSIRNLKSILE